MTQTAFEQPDGSVVWREYQDLPGHPGERRVEDRRKFIESDFNGSSVLDLGCWAGQMMLEAKRLGAKEVLGIEIDREAIKIGREIGNEIVRDDLENPFMWKKLPMFDVVLCLAILGNMRNKVAVLSNAAQITGKVMYVEGHGTQHKFSRADWMDLFLTYTNFKTIEYLGEITTRPFFRLAREEKTILYIIGKNYNRIAIIGKPGAGKTFFSRLFTNHKIITDQEGVDFTGDKIVVDSHGALTLSSFDCVINIVSDRKQRLGYIAERSGSREDNQEMIDFVDTASPHYRKGAYDYFTITN